MADAPAHDQKPALVWVVVKKHTIPFVHEQVVAGPMPRERAMIERDVLVSNNLDPLATFEVQPREG
jgi:hypothetical protein